MGDAVVNLNNMREAIIKNNQGVTGVTSDDIIREYENCKDDRRFKDALRDLFMALDRSNPDAADNLMLAIQKKEYNLARDIETGGYNTSRISGTAALNGVDISDISTKWHPNLKFKKRTDGKLEINYVECHGNPQKTEVKTTAIDFSGLKQLKISIQPRRPIVWELKAVYQNGDEKPVATLFIDDGRFNPTYYFKKPE